MKIKIFQFALLFVCLFLLVLPVHAEPYPDGVRTVLIKQCIDDNTSKHVCSCFLQKMEAKISLKDLTDKNYDSKDLQSMMADCILVEEKKKHKISSGTKPQKLNKRRQAKLYAVAFYGNPGTSSCGGATRQVTIRVEPNQDNDISVATGEALADGTGDTWRATVWMAAILSSQTLKMALIDHEFFLKSGGFIDGPSAGMLFTASFMALLNGDTINTKATMTGTINPDGTSGPVSGIPEKMVAASELGLKKFGYPIGKRNSKSS